jgi:hypothetical protein
MNANMELIHKLSRKDLVKRLPYHGYIKKVICDAYQYKKQIKNFFKAKNQVSTNNLFIWTFDSICISSFDCKRFVFVIVDDYTIFT